MERKGTYLDYAATTPLDGDAEKAMRPYVGKVFGNPGSLHRFGQEAQEALDGARKILAGLAGAKFENIIFTGSATEANNLVLSGVSKKKGKVLVSAVEHASVLEPAKSLEERGMRVVRIPVDGEGQVDTDVLQRELDDEAVLVSVMYANNETGTLEPVREIGEMVKKQRGKGEYPLFHTDAVQAFGYLPCDVDDLGVDFMTLSAHKMYGPKGVGVLYGRDWKYLKPFVYGGGQEFGLRPGTQNVAGIVGCAAAARKAFEVRERESRRVGELRRRFIEGLREISPDIAVHGGDEVLPHIVNASLPGVSAEDALIRLDMQGFAVSSGSACGVRARKPSHVLRALGVPEEEIDRSLRISFGRETDKDGVDRVLRAIRELLGA